MTKPIVALEELSIELSNYCLCRCIHCSSGSQPKRVPDELQPYEIGCLIEEARELGATVLSLSGGDPLVYNGIGTVVGYVKLAREIGYERILFYTSGIWEVDLEQLEMPGAEPLGALWGIDSWPYLEDLIDAGGDALTVIFSLHSHRPDVHDFITGIPGAWYTTTGGIMSLVAKGVDVEVHMVPMLPNYLHISKMRDLCAQMGVSKLSLLRFVPQTRGFSNKDILELGLGEFRYIQETLDFELGMRCGPLYPHIVELRPGCPIDFRHTIGAAPSKPKPCHAGLDLILVRPDGSVHPCAAWKTLPDDVNVRDASLEEIWAHGDVFNALRKYHTSGYLVFAGPCSSCNFLDSCKGGCPAQKLHAYGKSLNAIYYPASDPLCLIGAKYGG